MLGSGRNTVRIRQILGSTKLGVWGAGCTGLRKLLGFGILSKTTPDLLILIYYFQGKNVISKTSTVFL